MLALVRDPILSRIDRRLAAIIAGSLVVHIGIAVYAWSADLEEAPGYGAAQPQLSYEQEVIDIVIPDPIEEPPVAHDDAPGVAAPVRPTKQVPRPIVVHPTITTSTSVDPQNLAGLLTGNDRDDEELRRTPRLDLAEQIRQTREAQWQVGLPAPTTPQDHLGTTHVEIPLDDPRLTHTTHAQTPEPDGRVIPGDIKQDTSTTLTPAAVLARIQAQYMAGLQRCYRVALGTDAQLAGKVSIGFTITETGAVTDPDASGVSPGVDSCVEKQMGRWRFPIPKDAHGAPTETTYSVSLALQPS